MKALTANRQKAFIAVACLASVSIGLVGIAVTNISKSSPAASSKGLKNRSTEDKVAAYGYDAFSGPILEEISLDEARKDSKVKVIVPKYLPAGAKLDVVRRNTEGIYSITQNYDLGEEWIDVLASLKPTPPDYAKDANPITTAERVKPDGTKESVTINSGLVIAEPQPDGTLEPVGKDKHSLVSINGIQAHYVETKGIGTVRMGKEPKRVSMRDFAAITLWKDGMEYTIGGSNITRSELIKIAESLF